MEAGTSTGMVPATITGMTTITRTTTITGISMTMVFMPISMICRPGRQGPRVSVR